MSKRRTYSPEFKARVAMEVFDDNLVEGALCINKLLPGTVVTW